VKGTKKEHGDGKTDNFVKMLVASPRSSLAPFMYILESKKWK